MKKHKLVDLSHTIPDNYTDAWYKDDVKIFFYDRFSCVDLFQKSEGGKVQHLTLTPQDYLNFTARLQAVGFKNATIGHVS